MSNALLFEDIFHVNVLNESGKKFDKVNRLTCKGLTYEMDLVLDINSDIYSVKQDDKITFVLASTLALDGAPDDGTYRMIEYEVS
jgi:DNA-directed RNA polymerase I, II, and III subunit RPABC3